MMRSTQDIVEWINDALELIENKAMKAIEDDDLDAYPVILASATSLNILKEFIYE